jgi:hypothetical protein
MLGVDIGAGEMAPFLHLGSKVTEPIGERFYQIGFVAVAGVGCPKGVDAPAFRLTTCDQGSYTDDFVEGVFWKVRPQGLPNFHFTGRAFATLIYVCLTFSSFVVVKIASRACSAPFESGGFRESTR